MNRMAIQVWSSGERSGDTKLRVISVFKPMGLDEVAPAVRIDGEEESSKN